jgi:uncharacterized membrane protein YdbT with pleckstrin-like domain
MSYSKESLIHWEKIIFETKLSSSTYLVGVIIFIIILIVVPLFGGSFGVAMLFGTCILIWVSIGVYLNIQNSEFTITNRRVLIKTGILSTRSLELLINNIEGIYVEQTAFNKLFGGGSLIIRWLGNTSSIYPNIDKSLEFRKVLVEQIEKIKKGKH